MNQPAAPVPATAADAVDPADPAYAEPDTTTATTVEKVEPAYIRARKAATNLLPLLGGSTSLKEVYTAVALGQVSITDGKEMAMKGNQHV